MLYEVITRMAFTFHCIFWPVALSLFVKDRVEIFPLSRQYVIIVKISRFIKQIPFADYCRLIPQPFEFDGQILLSSFQGAVQIQHSVGLRMLPGNNTCPPGGADNIIAKHIFDQYPFRCQSVDVRRWVQCGQSPSYNFV